MLGDVERGRCLPPTSAEGVALKPIRPLPPKSDWDQVDVAKLISDLDKDIRTSEMDGREQSPPSRPRPLQASSSSSSSSSTSTSTSSYMQDEADKGLKMKIKRTKSGRQEIVKTDGAGSTKSSAASFNGGFTNDGSSDGNAAGSKLSGSVGGGTNSTGSGVHHSHHHNTHQQSQSHHHNHHQAGGQQAPPSSHHMSSSMVLNGPTAAITVPSTATTAVSRSSGSTPSSTASSGLATSSAVSSMAASLSQQQSVMVVGGNGGGNAINNSHSLSGLASNSSSGSGGPSSFCSGSGGSSSSSGGPDSGAPTSSSSGGESGPPSPQIRSDYHPPLSSHHHHNNPHLAVTSEVNGGNCNNISSSNSSNSNAALANLHSNRPATTTANNSSNNSNLSGLSSMGLQQLTTSKLKVDVGTVTHASTLTEPEMLGPCEPGTAVNLEGIVWHETDTGVLVVNITWRGKTYVGTLLDCARHTNQWSAPRFTDSPEPGGKGRGKRGRSNATPSEPEPRKNLRSSKGKGKGAKGAASSKGLAQSAHASPAGGHQSAGGGTDEEFNFPAPASPAKDPAKRKKETDTDESKKRKRTSSDSDDSSSMQEDSVGSGVGKSGSPPPTVAGGASVSSSNPLGSPAVLPTARREPRPFVYSYKMLECPRKDCSKQYKQEDGLRWHVSHSHPEFIGPTGDIRDSSEVEKEEQDRKRRNRNKEEKEERKKKEARQEPTNNLSTAGDRGTPAKQPKLEENKLVTPMAAGAASGSSAVVSASSQSLLAAGPGFSTDSKAKLTLPISSQHQQRLTPVSQQATVCSTPPVGGGLSVSSRPHIYTPPNSNNRIPDPTTDDLKQRVAVVSSSGMTGLLSGPQHHGGPPHPVTPMAHVSPSLDREKLPANSPAFSDISDDGDDSRGGGKDVKLCVPPSSTHSSAIVPGLPTSLMLGATPPSSAPPLLSSALPPPPISSFVTQPPPIRSSPLPRTSTVTSTTSLTTAPHHINNSPSNSMQHPMHSHHQQQILHHPPPPTAPQPTLLPPPTQQQHHGQLVTGAHAPSAPPSSAPPPLPKSSTFSLTGPGGGTGPALGTPEYHKYLAANGFPPFPYPYPVGMDPNYHVQLLKTDPVYKAKWEKDRADRERAFKEQLDKDQSKYSGLALVKEDRLQAGSNTATNSSPSNTHHPRKQPPMDGSGVGLGSKPEDLRKREPSGDNRPRSRASPIVNTISVKPEFREKENPSPPVKREVKCEEGVKPTMETRGPPPGPQTFGYMHPSLIRPPYSLGVLPPHFDPIFVSSGGMSSLGPYGLPPGVGVPSPYLPSPALMPSGRPPVPFCFGDPLLRAPFPLGTAADELARAAAAAAGGSAAAAASGAPPGASSAAVAGAAAAGAAAAGGPGGLSGTKALDLLQQHASQYYANQKLAELQERALKSPISSMASVASLAGGSGGSPSSLGGGGKPITTLACGKEPPTTLSAANASKSPPPLRHVHTHTHTHIGLGYPLLPPGALPSVPSSALPPVGSLPPGALPPLPPPPVGVGSVPFSAASAAYPGKSPS